MKPLEKQFERKGWNYTQITRDETSAVYQREKGRCVDWEVIAIRRSKGGSMKIVRDGVEQLVTFEPKEIYPSDEEWGDRGWTYTEERAALEKFETLKNRKETKR